MRTIGIMYLLLAAMLLLCLVPMPYGYYSLVRFWAMVGFGVIAYKYYQAKNEEFLYCIEKKGMGEE